MQETELKECFDILQEQNNKLYNEFGSIEEVMNLQIIINQLRNKYNIPDESKMTDSNPGFVQ